MGDDRSYSFAFGTPGLSLPGRFCNLATPVRGIESLSVIVERQTPRSIFATLRFCTMLTSGDL